MEIEVHPKLAIEDERLPRFRDLIQQVSVVSKTTKQVAQRHTLLSLNSSLIPLSLPIQRLRDDVALATVNRP